MTSTQPKTNSNFSKENVGSTATAIREKPPIFTGFELLEDSENGFFIRNTADKSVFKWIDVESLEENGVFYNESVKSKGGRRDFECPIHDLTLRNSNYIETDDSNFKKCVRKFGGFYFAISRARAKSSGTINFANDGYLVDLIKCSKAKIAAKNYAKDFASNNEFISCMPCGAAFDCVYEHIFELFRKEVQLAQKPDEIEYDAWNRCEKTLRKHFRTHGIYGIFDLIDAGEYSTEIYSNKSMIAYRGRHSHGLYLIAHSDEAKKSLTASFPAGTRNFMSADLAFMDYGYRVILLPQEI